MTDQAPATLNTDPKTDAPSASGTKPAPPCTLVLFGASGDLTKRLLMPALYNLSGNHLLDEQFSILGLDRVDRSSEAWRDDMTKNLQSFTTDTTAEFHTDKIDENAWNWIAQRLNYMTGDFGDPATYAALKGKIKGNVVFYLAVAARFFGPIVEQLGHAGLLAEADNAFRRVVIEKPFGADLPSARALNQQILSVASEQQIYRIDHFLGKETVQSLMAVRFGNGIFEPLWRRDFIDHIQITAAETIGVEARGGFYEPTGALRDMVPNHLFQLLCMTAMEPPNSFDAEAVRNEKAKLIDAVRPVLPENVVRGQYAAGHVLGEDARAYREEPQVAPDSNTETYVALKLSIENWRWAGVPFYLRTGKRLAERRTEIAIHFKTAPYRIFRDTPVDSLPPNVLTLMIDPTHGTRLGFNVKIPGPEMKLGQVNSSFRYRDFFDEKPNVGYETLLYDCMLGDATLFQRADNIETSWSVVQPALDRSGAAAGVELYAAGTAGPAAADHLLEKDGRHWVPLGAPDKGDKPA
ncbi:MAG: glucose-6-phosphate dehydrogenase [Janthinobacterium lividum]